MTLRVCNTFAGHHFCRAAGQSITAMGIDPLYLISTLRRLCPRLGVCVVASIGWEDAVRLPLASMGAFLIITCSKQV